MCTFTGDQNQDTANKGEQNPKFFGNKKLSCGKAHV